MTEINGLKIGDYCHASRWSDKDPLDPWAIGHLSEILITEHGILFKLKGKNVPNRWFKHCEKITQKQGQEYLECANYTRSQFETKTNIPMEM